MVVASSLVNTYITLYSENATPWSGKHAPSFQTPRAGRLPNVVEDMDEPVPTQIGGFATSVYRQVTSILVSKYNTFRNMSVNCVKLCNCL
jgi:hypothetical protein